jgi:transcriptional regulator with XRE-family HTH domain
MKGKTKVDFKDRLAHALNDKGIKPIDLSKATGIPKSTISYYLSGRNEAKSDRVYSIAKYLNVNEAWLMGYDVPMQRDESQKKNDQLVELVARMRRDEGFADVVRLLNNLRPEQYDSIKQLLSAFVQK